MSKAKNILGTALQSCCMNPKTGFMRDGFCNTNQYDGGSHVVCAIVTQDFLTYTKNKGNDLSTPRPEVFNRLMFNALGQIGDYFFILQILISSWLTVRRLLAFVLFKMSLVVFEIKLIVCFISHCSIYC